MERFFDRPDTRWRSASGCLHLYLLPDGESSAPRAFAAAADALRGVPSVARQPPQYLHVTLQRFDAFRDDLLDQRWGAVRTALAVELARLPAFSIAFRAPAARSHAVEAVGEPSSDWLGLLDTVRRVVTGMGLSAQLEAPPSVPHFTVGYCVDPVSDAVVDRALSGAAMPSSLRVGRVALVAVDQRRDAGIFAFERVDDWPLGVGRRETAMEARE